jgi:hypothetical protein
MLDLTLDELYELRSDLFTDALAVHESIIDAEEDEEDEEDEEGQGEEDRLVPAFVCEWARWVQIQVHAAILDQIAAVSDEISRREAANPSIKNHVNSELGPDA